MPRIESPKQSSPRLHSRNRLRFFYIEPAGIITNDHGLEPSLLAGYDDKGLDDGAASQLTITLHGMCFEEWRVWIEKSHKQDKDNIDTNDRDDFKNPFPSSYLRDWMFQEPKYQVSNMVVRCCWLALTLEKEGLPRDVFLMERELLQWGCIACETNVVQVWNVQSKEQVASINAPLVGISCLDVCNDASNVVVAWGGPVIQRRSRPEDIQTFALEGDLTLATLRQNSGMGAQLVVKTRDNFIFEEFRQAEPDMENHREIIRRS